MAIEVMTKEDLQDFRKQLLDDIIQIFGQGKPKPARPWLKNAEVKSLLNISANTVQRLRVTGKLHSSKIGGIHYYRYEDIEKLMKSEIA